MNRLCYRIVFNRTRAMPMAVAETASSTGTGKRATSAAGRPARRTSPDLAWIGIPAIKLAVWACMGLPMVAAAQIVADPNAGVNRPGVIQTANGLPQVNITRPTGAGVSINQYTQFDVNKPGAILNNSPVITNTQQAGYINGNPNLLPGGSARIIVNQVNSTSPSQLRGYLEVAGGRADVVIANPNGLLVDGAGFINTSRVTLTTGMPIYGGSGSLDAFRVTGGQIQIEGAGLNAASVDQVDLIARAVRANAALYANRLNVVAGANQVDYNTLSASAIAGNGPAPAVGIDVSQLGGMYANKILLASTEAGVGVSLRGVMAAQAGDLTLTAQGKLVLAGQTNASGNLAMSARDGIDNSGTTYGEGAASLRTDGTLTNSGTLAAQRSLDVNAQSVASSGTLAAGMNADGTLGNAADLTVTAAGTVSATGLNLASGNAAIQGTTVSVAGSQTAANGNLGLAANAGNLDMTGATTAAAGNLAATATGALINDRGQLSSGAATSLTAGSVSNQGGQVVSQGTTTIQSAGAVNNTQGTVQSGGALTATAGSLDNTAGQIEGDALTVSTTGDLTNRGGRINQYGQTDATIIAGGKLDNTGGAVAANAQNLTVSAGSLTNDGGQVSHAGTGFLAVSSQGAASNAGGVIQTNGDLHAQAGSLNGTGGAMSAQRQFALTVQGALDNTNATLHAGDGLTLQAGGALTNAGGRIESAGTHDALSVSAASVDNTGGRITNAGDGLTQVTAQQQILNANGATGTTGLIGGNGALALSAGTVLTNQGLITARGDSTLTAQTVVNDNGSLTASGELSVASTSATSNRNGLISAATTELGAASLDNAGGRLEGDSVNVTTTGDLSNRGGTIKQYGQADTTITAGAKLDNTGGTIASNGANLAIGASTVVNDSGQVSHAGTGTLAVTSQGALSNAGGAIQTNGDLQAQATTLDNTRGTISAQGKAAAITSGNLVNRQGSLYGNTGLTLGSGGTVDNTAGSAQTAGDLTVAATGALVNQDGTLATNSAHGRAAISATSVDNMRGALLNAGDGATTVTARNTLTNTAGRLGGNGDVIINAQTLANNTNGTAGGSLAAGNDLNLNVTSQLDNSGGTLYGQSLTLDQTGTTLDNAGGQVLGGTGVKLNVASMSNAGGGVKANQDVAVSGAVSGSGAMIAGRNLTLNVSGNYTNDAANQLRANGDMRVAATGTLTNTATLAAAGALTVSGTNVVNTAGADINSASTTVTASNTISNAGRIEGNTVQTSSPTMINTGTVIGNNVQVQGTDIVNNGPSALMAAVQNLNLYAANSVQNLDGATLYSAGNLQIARDGTRDPGTGLLANQTNALINRSATIEADGDIDIAANQVSNTRTSIVTEAGTPEETARKTLTTWMAGFEGGMSAYQSASFPQWQWFSGSAAYSADMWNALRAPITVEVPKADVRYVDQGTKTLSFNKAPVDTYTQGGGCGDTECAPVTTVERQIATNPVQYYQAIEDMGSTYKITFWPNWDPSTNIRPDDVRVRYDLGPDVHDYNELSRTTVTTTATDRLVSASAAAVIQSGGNIRINSNGGSILNQSSTMAAGGNLVRSAVGGTVQDVGTVLQQSIWTTDTSTFYWHQKSGGNSDTQVVAYPTEAQASTTVAALPAIATANQAVQTSAHNVSVASVNAVGATVTSGSVSGGGATGTQLAGASGSAGAATAVSASSGSTVTGVRGQAWPPQTLGTARGGIPNLKLPTNGLFTIRPAPGDTYLVATDPRFTQYTNFISSDYMLGALGLDPQKTQKRLGDGFYEEKLVRDQVTQLTGRTFLTGYTDQLDEYKALMNNGVTYAKTFDLTPGVGLTDEQMRQLTTDMVWMVSQDVALPDGTTQSVLVPKVYLAQGNGVDLNSTGALVAGNAVSINATGTVQNSGAIVGDIATQVVGADIVNRGSIGGTGTTIVTAANDVRNIGGRIGGQDVVVSAGRDVINETQTVTNTTRLANGYSASATSVGAQATIIGTGNVAVLAGRDINLTGSSVGAGGNALLAAGRDINAGTVVLGTTQDISSRQGQSYSHDALVKHQSSDISAGAGLTAVAGRDIGLTNTAMNAGSDLTLVAGQNLVVANATDTRSHAEASLGGKGASYAQSSYDETVRGSTVEAGGAARLGAGQRQIASDVLAANGIVAAQASGGGSLGVIGSTVSAGKGADGGNVTMVAKDDIVVAEAREVHDASSEQRSRSSGFLSRKSSYDAISTHENIGVGSLISGDTVTAVAGNDLLIRQSAVTATDAVNLTATRGDVVITAGENTRESTEAHERSASGVSFSAGKGGIGMSAGSSNAKSNAHTVAVTQSDARSTVGATNGNVTIVAGKDATIVGSDLIAGRVGDNKDAGHIAIQAENITVTTGVDNVVQDSSQSNRSTSFGIHVVGTPLDTIRNLQDNNQSDSTVTRVKQNLGEIGHSAGTAPQVAVTFGKNSSNATSHVESVTNSGSTLTGAGDITLRATGNGQSDTAGKPIDGDILLHGSAISAGGKATLDAQRNVNIEASTDTYSESTSSNSSGWKISTAVATLGDIGRNLNGSANNSGVSTLPFGTQKSSASGDLSVSQQNASTVTGDSVSIVSRTGDVRIAGSGVAAENDIAIAAKQGRVDILSGQDARSQRSDSSSRVIGDLGGDGYTGMTGIRTESHHLDESGTSENTIRSQVVSQSGSVSISAKDDLTARGADIAAGQDVTLIGKNVVLDPGTDDSARNQVDKSSQYGVTLALSGYSITAAKAAEAAARAVEDGKDDRVAGLYAAQAGLALVNGRVIGKEVLTSAGQQTPEVIKVTVSVGGGSQQSESHSTASNQQGTTVKAGNAVTVVATGSGQKDADGFATDGDITGRGVQISGKTVDLVAARDVTLESAQDRASNDSRSSGNNFGIGVGFALGGAQNGFTLELSAAQNKAKVNGESVTNENSHVSATDSLTVTSGRDTNLKGAQLIAERIEGSVGRDLNVESRQDTETYHSKESSSGMQASICVPPFCYGTTVNASATMSSGNTDSTYASVREQSGIYAGLGGFDVNVKGNTDLKGGILASTADSSKNSLTTGTLTTSDIENKAEYSSDSSQYAASFSAGKSVPDGKDLAGNAVKQGVYMADNQNLAGNLANTAMASAAGNAQKPITGNASGTTKSAIAAGTVIITDADGQQAKTGKTVEETLASLNRDTENANQSIDKIFDAQKVKDEQALRQLTGQTIQQAAPIIYHQVGKALQGQDETVKVAVHALVGGLVSKALGGDFGTGAAGVAASTAAIAVLDANLGSLGVDPATKDKLLQLVGTAVAGAIGGNAAAATAGMADAYNRQLHNVSDADLRRKAGELAKDPKYAGLTQDEIYYAIRSVYRNDQVGTGDLKSFDSEAAAKSAGVPASYDPTTGKWLEDPEVATARLDGTQRTQLDSNLRNDLWNTGGAFKAELIEASKPSASAVADAVTGAAITGLGRFGVVRGDGGIAAEEAGATNSAAIRAKVEANLAESAAARASSNFGTLNEWPPYNGFVPGTAERYTLFPGQQVDRYGSVQGTFVAEAGTAYRARALRPGSDSAPYNIFEVTRPIEVTAGPARPWFGYEGMGTQYKFNESVRNLIQSGALRRVQ